MATIVAVPLQAQVDLGAPDVEFEEGFGLIQGIRELSDGRVLVADRAGRLLAFVDFEAGTLQTIGRVGQGPDEYGLPGSLVALPGDRSMLMDLGNMRLVEIDSDGTFVTTYPAMRSTGHSSGLVVPRASDSDGWLYFQPRGMGPGGVTGYVLRWHPETDVIEEVATLARAPVRQSGNMGAPPPFPLNDDWHVHGSGAVAIAKAAEYRVVWVKGDERTAGPIQSYEPVRITDADREDFRERLSRTALTMDVDSDGSVGGASSPGRSMVDQAYPDDVFPSQMGPFMEGGVRVAPWGEVWVRRSVEAGEPAHFDVFDRAGERVRQVVLEPGVRLMGFGPAHIFTVRTDELGLEYLQRRSR